MMYTRTQERVYIYVVYQDIVDKQVFLFSKLALCRQHTMSHYCNIELHSGHIFFI